MCILVKHIFDPRPPLSRWAIAECYRKELDPEPANLRSVLTDVFKLIRFPVMSLQEFTTRVTSTGILSDSEELSLLRYYTHAYRPKTEFSDKPRGLVTSSGREWMKMVLENASIATRPTFCVRRFRHHTSSAENASPNGINRIRYFGRRRGLSVFFFFSIIFANSLGYLSCEQFYG